MGVALAYIRTERLTFYSSIGTVYFGAPTVPSLFPVSSYASAKLETEQEIWAVTANYNPQAPKVGGDWLLDKFAFEAKRTGRAENYKLWRDDNHAIDLTNRHTMEKVNYIH